MKKQKVLLLTLALTGGTILTGIQSLSRATKIRAEEIVEVKNTELTSFTMLTGARIKISADGYNNSGLRFEGEISKSDYDSVVASNGTFGMVIIPSRLLEGNLDNFTSEYYTDTANYMHLDFGTSLEEDNGKYRLIGAITRIHLSNLSEEFIASAYIRYTNESSTTYEKAGFSGDFSDHSRSCRTVAEKLIEKGDENATWLNRYYLNREQVSNYGFESDDFTGWTVKDSDVSVGSMVSSEKTYFNGENELVQYKHSGKSYLEILQDGSRFLMTDDAFTGTIVSPSFTLGGDGWISFKLGAAKNDTTGLRIVNAETGEIIASFHNTEFGKDGNEGKLIQYAYQATELESDTYCYIEIFDNATSDWGLVSADSIVTNYTAAPTFEYVTAVNDLSE